MRGKEKPKETQLINALRAAGFYAVHMDCSVDGFPDIFAAREDRAFLIEVKSCGISASVGSVFEATQPVFGFSIAKSGFRSVYAAVWVEAATTAHQSAWAIITMDTLLATLLQHPRLHVADLPRVAVCQTSEDAAAFFKRLSE